MKRYILINLLCILSVILIPLMCVRNEAPARDVKITEAGETVTVKTYIKKEDRVCEMDLEEYLWGVVSAEMPASFPLEALKAQAVAARTYVINRIKNGAKDDATHKGADVCTDSAHCKAWLSEEERLSKWEKDKREEYKQKISAAVNDTRGVIMTYGGEPITAVFYAISSGKTENSKDVWGGDLPYLKSVESPYDKNAPGYESTVTLSLSEFRQKVSDNITGADLSGEAKGWYKNEKRSEGGAVISCEIGGVTVKGTKVRTVFGLRSHNYTVAISDNVVFSVKGYGHGVGMSQWGARFFAEQGKSYRDILRTYYSGIEFDTVS